ncbi:MAG: hypothetical protein M1820_006695 [Bogoriella megaspora]|nr:MAG: hypothetical protein M1820_006695 [Bogoriella megaspora]
MPHFLNLDPLLAVISVDYSLQFFPPDSKSTSPRRKQPSIKMAWQWLSKIGVTPTTILFIQQNPASFYETLAVFFIIFVLFPSFCYYIHYQTSKNQGTYRPPFSEGIPFITKGKKGKNGGRK